VGVSESSIEVSQDYATSWVFSLPGSGFVSEGDASTAVDTLLKDAPDYSTTISRVVVVSMIIDSNVSDVLVKEAVAGAAGIASSDVTVQYLRRRLSVGESTRSVTLSVDWDQDVDTIESSLSDPATIEKQLRDAGVDTKVNISKPPASKVRVHVDVRTSTLNDAIVTESFMTPSEMVKTINDINQKLNLSVDDVEEVAPAATKVTVTTEIIDKTVATVENVASVGSSIESAASSALGVSMTIATFAPTLAPTDRPTVEPTLMPTANPTIEPTLEPSPPTIERWGDVEVSLTDAFMTSIFGPDFVRELGIGLQRLSLGAFVSGMQEGVEAKQLFGHTLRSTWTEAEEQQRYGPTESARSVTNLGLVRFSLARFLMNDGQREAAQQSMAQALAHFAHARKLHPLNWYVTMKEVLERARWADDAKDHERAAAGLRDLVADLDAARRDGLLDNAVAACVVAYSVAKYAEVYFERGPRDMVVPLGELRSILARASAVVDASHGGDDIGERASPHEFVLASVRFLDEFESIRRIFTAPWP